MAVPRVPTYPSAIVETKRLTGKNMQMKVINTIFRDVQGPMVEMGYLQNHEMYVFLPLIKSSIIHLELLTRAIDSISHTKPSL